MPHAPGRSGSDSSGYQQRRVCSWSAQGNDRVAAALSTRAKWAGMNKHIDLGRHTAL